MTDTINNTTGAPVIEATTQGHVYLVRHHADLGQPYRPTPDQGEPADQRVYLAGVASDDDSFLILDADRYAGHAWAMTSNYTERLYPQYLGWRGYWQSRERFTVLADLTEMGALVQPPVEADRSDMDVAALVDEARRLREEHTELRRQRTEAVGLQRNAEVELDRFRAKVREVAIEAAEEHDWCSVIDDLLRDMGLEPRTRTYQVSVDVTFAMTCDVEASSEDEARERVNEGDQPSYITVPDFIEGAPFTDNSVYYGDVTVTITDVSIDD